MTTPGLSVTTSPGVLPECCGILRDTDPDHVLLNSTLVECDGVVGQQG
ncbi:hypothetical protein ACWDSD_31725 [Streptomyces spiralis]